MWKRFPKVLNLDNTYKTNRYQYPLFQITGQTCLGSVFNAAFNLIDNERLNGFIFLTTQLRHLAEQHIIRLSNIVGTSSVNNVCALALSLMQLMGTDTGRACRRP
jgi:hypothetical protein